MPEYGLHRFKKGTKSKLTPEGAYRSWSKCTQVINYTELDNPPLVAKAGLLEGRRQQLLKNAPCWRESIPSGERAV